MKTSIVDDLLETIIRLQSKLQAKQNNFSKRQETFLIMAENEINTSCFERNAIAELTVMLEEKTQIKELEQQIQTLQTLRNN